MSAAEVAPASSQKGILGWIERTGTKTVITTANLLSADNIQSLWVEMPKTFTHFHPLGYVLVVMRGAGVAERAGLFGTSMRAGVRGGRSHTRSD
jgi:p-aminobenzoyl-glutamate transporter AbgT